MSDLKLLLKLGGITKQTYEDLRMLPTTPADENGKPFEEWYLIVDDAIYIIKTTADCKARVEKIPL